MIVIFCRYQQSLWPRVLCLSVIVVFCRYHQSLLPCVLSYTFPMWWETSKHVQSLDILDNGQTIIALVIWTSTFILSLKNMCSLKYQNDSDSLFFFFFHMANYSYEGKGNFSWGICSIRLTSENVCGVFWWLMIDVQARVDPWCQVPPLGRESCFV